MLLCVTWFHGIHQQAGPSNSYLSLAASSSVIIIFLLGLHLPCFLVIAARAWPKAPFRSRRGPNMLEICRDRGKGTLFIIQFMPEVNVKRRSSWRFRSISLSLLNGQRFDLSSIFFIKVITSMSITINRQNTHDKVVISENLRREKIVL